MTWHYFKDLFTLAGYLMNLVLMPGFCKKCFLNCWGAIYWGWADWSFWTLLLLLLFVGLWTQAADIGWLGIFIDSMFLPWSVILDNSVKSIKLDLILANISIKHDTGMLKLITPQNLTWQVGGSHLQTDQGLEIDCLRTGQLTGGHYVNTECDLNTLC
jgi:hypothetical protein